MVLYSYIPKKFHRKLLKTETETSILLTLVQCGLDLKYFKTPFSLQLSVLTDFSK